MTKTLPHNSRPGPQETRGYARNRKRRRQVDERDEAAHDTGHSNKRREGENTRKSIMRAQVHDTGGRKYKTGRRKYTENIVNVKKKSKTSLR